jgi:carbonic anhydrase
MQRRVGNAVRRGRQSALLAALLVVGGAAVAVASEPGDGPSEHSSIHWGYSAENGPARWDALSPDWALCGKGRSQSPVDLGGAKPAAAVELSFGYQPASLKIIHHEHVVDVLNNGHTIQVNYDEGSTIDIQGTRFELLQYHFHTPSEHTVAARHFPMEMHLVHQSQSGEVAAVGVFIEAGAHNAAFEPVWEHVPKETGKQEHLEHVVVDVDQLLPRDRRTYRYPGSFTTPPCSEGVHWLVFVEPIQLGQEQIDAFRAVVKDNNRPVQPLEGREVLIERTPAR